MSTSDLEPGRFSGYDLIGDVHGCARTLEILLQRMGYTQEGGVYRHPRRQAIFIGDIVDRGPRIREALRIVRDMVEEGSARIVMGNHEYYSLAWSTQAPQDSDQEFVRDHMPRHERVIRETLQQFADYPDEWADALDWFLTLPLFLELENFRCVHACWDQQLIDYVRSRCGGNVIDEAFLVESADPDSMAHRVFDRLLRGTNMQLPDDRSMTSSDGFTRRYFRTKFWANNPQTYAEIVFQPDALPADVEAMPIPASERAGILTYPESEPALFMGHYWMEGRPQPLKSNLVCLDYSAVKYGSLVAYRYDGEETLDQGKFVWVDVTRG